MINYDDITAACRHYDEAAERYNDCTLDKKHQIDAIDKDFEQPLAKLTEELESALYDKHLRVARTVIDYSQWYKDKQLLDYVLHCVYVEEAAAYFYIYNKYPVTHAVDARFKDIFAGLVKSVRFTQWNNRNNVDTRFFTPTLRIPADTTDAKLEQLATNLDEYLVSMSELKQPASKDRPIYVPVNDHGSQWDTWHCGLYFTAPNNYALALQSLPGKNYPPKDNDIRPLLDILKKIREKYYYNNASS